MIRRPPRSTLFPYTTLFRSGRGKFRLFDCATNNFKRLVSACAGPDGGPDSFGDLGKLFASGGTIDVGRNHKRAMAMLRQPFGEFAGRGGFAGPLQTDDHPYRRRPRSKERFGVLTEKRSKLIANNLDDLLVRRQLQHDFTAERLTSDVGKEFVHDAEGDVAFQHGLANFR